MSALSQETNATAPPTETTPTIPTSPSPPLLASESPTPTPLTYEYPLPQPLTSESPTPTPFTYESQPPLPLTSESPPPTLFTYESPPPQPLTSESPTPTPFTYESPPPQPLTSESPTPTPSTYESQPPPPSTSYPTPPPTVTTPTITTSPPPPPVPQEKGSMPTGKLVGMIVGIGGISMLVAVAIFVIFYRRWKKKKMREQGFGNYNSEAPQQNKKNESSGDSPQRLQKIDPPPADTEVMFPKPAPPSGIAAGPPPSSSENSRLGSEKPPPPPPPSPGIALGFSQSTFTYEELAIATNGFSTANFLGQGGFGYVHKGVLPNGKVVAIKQLKAGSGQGEREFRAEVELISRVHHRHLVSLVGYCISGAQRMLIYEFIPNNTLEFHLHGKRRPKMNWPTRMKIALGSARGLAYLHEDCQPKIIHRDIKAANILLQDNFEAKVADFGLAKISLETDTHVSTRIMGTLGYLAPEYATSGKLTDKSDVFSFGVVLLELITGRRPIDRTQSFTDDSMVEWARPLLMPALESGNFNDLVDPKLQNDYNSSEMTKMVACAAACVSHSARLRPRMSQIVRALEGNISLDDLNGATPGHRTVFYSYGSTDYNTSQYQEDLRKFQKLALQSQQQGPSECSGPSSDFGQHHPSASSSEGQQTTQELELEKMKKDTHT
ncbi:hypothetical protein FNV43_RR06838 [Rhamnella rubrinervis]|uniref:non-specific serine/threonine protein kinase n=1 Tax=Rhamnella rubrinervis TaxID=2594499 RepID=A0A8K0HFC2_9ROSA|nr:hypothetical protein FNV43_RR06838 [Rhamnella rubrinervis]